MAPEQDGTLQFIDQVLLSKFEAPTSYTGEDLVEIGCHGSIYLANKIVEVFILTGARMAEPGEFTKRAFLNGKMDLIQAEAVADLIQSQTAQSQKIAASLLTGKLSERLQSLKNQLLQTCAMLEVELDFSEEDIELISRDELEGQIQTLVEEVESLLTSYKTGKILREGATIVIAGSPNVGKSSILNHLLQEDRAIVSELPGTTRDHLEEKLDIGGYLFRVIDTAGLRNPTDPVEIEGVQRSLHLITQADILLIVIDTFTGLRRDETDQISGLIEQARKADQNLILVLNKIDLLESSKAFQLPPIFQDINQVYVSAQTGQGFRELEQQLISCCHMSTREDNSVMITRTRHRDLLRLVKTDLEQTQESLRHRFTSEFISLDLRSAMNRLGELTGEVTNQDILNHIFNHFCIGK